MMHDIGKELAAQLAQQDCPFKVVDGPEATGTTTYARERIVVEYDEGGDRFGPPRSPRPNPKHIMTRSVGGKITIYAQSGYSGAKEFEHRRRAEHALDMVLVGMHKVARLSKNSWTPTGGKFIQPADLENSERPAGAVYELSFTFDRAVVDRTWAGDALPETIIDGGEDGIGVDTETHVSVNGSEDFEVI